MNAPIIYPICNGRECKNAGFIKTLLGTLIRQRIDLAYENGMADEKAAEGGGK